MKRISLELSAMTLSIVVHSIRRNSVCGTFFPPIPHEDDAAPSHSQMFAGATSRPVSWFDSQSVSQWRDSDSTGKDPRKLNLPEAREREVR